MPMKSVTGKNRLQEPVHVGNASQAGVHPVHETIARLVEGDGDGFVDVGKVSIERRDIRVPRLKQFTAGPQLAFHLLKFQTQFTHERIFHHQVAASMTVDPDEPLVLTGESRYFRLQLCNAKSIR
jgi:hypothetical protein